jgi:hypothetical protein
MFQFPSLPRYNLCIQLCVTRHYSGGVAPFGDPRIVDYNVSPRLFAVYCVLHRLLMPRYSPCALCSFTILQSLNAFHHNLHRFRGSNRDGHSKSSGQRLVATTHHWCNLRTSICSFQGTGPELCGLSVGRRVLSRNLFFPLTALIP